MAKSIAFLPVTLLFSGQLQRKVIVELGPEQDVLIVIMARNGLKKVFFLERVHDSRDFKGHIDNRFEHGYSGVFLERGDRSFNNFRGNEVRHGGDDIRR